MTAATPPRGRTSIAALRRDIAQLHECVHSVSGKVEDLVVSVSETRERVAFMQGVQESITLRLGVKSDPGEPPKPAMLMSFDKPLKTFLAVAGAASGIVVVYQLAAMALPGMLAALHHALMTIS